MSPIFRIQQAANCCQVWTTPSHHTLLSRMSPIFRIKHAAKCLKISSVLYIQVFVVQFGFFGVVFAFFWCAFVIFSPFLLLKFWRLFFHHVFPLLEVLCFISVMACWPGWLHGVVDGWCWWGIPIWCRGQCQVGSFSSCVSLNKFSRSHSGVGWDYEYAAVLPHFTRMAQYSWFFRQVRSIWNLIYSWVNGMMQAT